MSEPQPLTKREQAWVERLRKTMAAQPESLYLFFAGSINVMRPRPEAYDETTRRDEVLDTVEVVHMDGGDW